MSEAPKSKSKSVVMNINWKGEHRFDTSRPNGPVSRIDGSGESGQSPVDALLSALAACAAIDVVEILAKRRTPVKSLDIEALGERVDTIPQHYKRIKLRFRITGVGIERDQALRAIELGVTKYCSVRSSLDPAIPIDWDLELSES